MKTATKPKAKFPIGSPVSARSFVDCFGKHHDTVSGLTVIELKLNEPVSMKPWYRVTAIGENGKNWIQASESFFEEAGPCTA